VYKAIVKKNKETGNIKKYYNTTRHQMKP